MKARHAFWICSAALFVHLCLAVSPAAAQSDEERARAAFRLGRAHYDNGDFLKAAKEFERAFELSGKYQLLYNVYLAYRDANMTKQAADALRGYLANTADVPNRAQLAAKLKALEKSLKDEEAKKTPPPAAVVAEPEPKAEPEPEAEPGPEAEPEPEGEPEPEAAEEEPAEEEAAAEVSSGDTNLVPFILMGSGGAMVLGSIITGVMASSAQSELEDECPDKQCPADSDLEDTKSRGQTLAVVTDVLLFGGIAVAGTGLVLFLLEGAEEEPAGEGVTAGLACAPTGCAGAVRVSF
jgi:outer membrane biosynthesis protein TonB